MRFERVIRAAGESRVANLQKVGNPGSVATAKIMVVNEGKIVILVCAQSLLECSSMVHTKQFAWE